MCTFILEAQAAVPEKAANYKHKYANDGDTDYVSSHQRQRACTKLRQYKNVGAQGEEYCNEEQDQFYRNRGFYRICKMKPLGHINPELVCHPNSCDYHYQQCGNTDLFIFSFESKQEFRIALFQNFRQNSNGNYKVPAYPNSSSKEM